MPDLKEFVIAKIIVLDEKGDVLLLRRSKTAPRRPLEWDLPGGFVDPNDASYKAAALRELQEEAGVRVDDAQLIFAESAVTQRDFAGSHPATWLYFVVQMPRPDIVIGNEHDAFVWVPVGQALKDVKYERQLAALRFVGQLMQ